MFKTLSIIRFGQLIPTGKEKIFSGLLHLSSGGKWGRICTRVFLHPSSTWKVRLYNDDSVIHLYRAKCLIPICTSKLISSTQSDLHCETSFELSWSICIFFITLLNIFIDTQYVLYLEHKEKDLIEFFSICISTTFPETHFYSRHMGIQHSNIEESAS